MLIKIDREEFKKEYGQPVISVWLNTPKGQKYVKPNTKGVWLLSDVLVYDICLTSVTLKLTRGVLSNLPK